MKKRSLPRRLRIAAATLSLAAVSLAFAAEWLWPAQYVSLQPGPALARLFAVAWPVWGAVAAVGAILLLTFLFGRFYCAALCPLGALQDFLGWLTGGGRRKASARAPDLWLLRYPVGGATLGALLGGSAFGLRLFDPFSRFGAVAATGFTPAFTAAYNRLFPLDLLQHRPLTTGMIIAAAATLVLLAALTFWKRRIFCTGVCPVGTLLGAVAARGPWRMRMNGDCAGCGRCARVCPAGCVDVPARAIDNERCLRCLNCLAACPKGALSLSLSRAPAEPATEATEAADAGRRSFLRGGGVAAAALAAGYVGAKAGAARNEPAGDAAGAGGDDLPILPPGAGSPERFAARCTDCWLCVTACRGQVLRAGNGVGRRVHMSFDKGMCEFNCQRCQEVCPAGAIVPQTLEQKQRWRIGAVRFDRNICVAVRDGTDCGACAEHCPTGAVKMQDTGSGTPTPQITPEICIGCGSCEFPCPVRPVKAIRVEPAPIQVLAADPTEYNRYDPATEPPLPPAAGDGEWLI